MKIRIFNFDTKELINSFSINTKDGVGDFFKIARTILAKMQETDDILKIGKNLTVKDWGFNTVFQNGITANTMSKGASCTCFTSEMSFTFGSNESLQEKEPTCVTLWNPNVEGGVETLDLRVGFIIFEEGWVIANGKIGSNIFGSRHNCYIASIGSRNIRTCAKSGAKIFKDTKAILSYLKKHTDTFKFCVEKYDYQLSIESTCDYFEEEYNATLSGKKLEKAKLIDEEIAALLEEINTSAEDTGDGYDDYTLPDEVTKETIFNEVLYRMKKYDLWDAIVKDYIKDGKIYLSEAGGIVYDLNEPAKKIVDELIEEGKTPFHVVHTVTTFGDLYQVLFVSNDTTNWRYERGRKDGYMYNCCYNETYDEVEYSESKFISCHGGMQRIA